MESAKNHPQGGRHNESRDMLGKKLSNNVIKIVDQNLFFTFLEATYTISIVLIVIFDCNGVGNFVYRINSYVKSTWAGY